MNKQPNGNLGISIVRPVMVGTMDGTALRHESKAEKPQFNIDGLVIWMDLAGDYINQGSASSLQVTPLGGGEPRFAPDKWGDPTGAMQNVWNSINTVIYANPSIDTSGGWSMVWWAQEFVDIGGGTAYIHRLQSDESFAIAIYRQGGYGSGGFARLCLDIITVDGYEAVDTGIGGFTGDDLQWHHYAITHNPDTNIVNFYVDGKSVAEIELTTATGVLSSVGAGTNPRFSFCSYEASPTWAYTANIARLSYWHRTLSANEVKTLCNNGEDFKFEDLGIPTNRLKDDLVAHWSLDETSGPRLDSHGKNHLTEELGTVASSAGLLGNMANMTAGGINQPQLVVVSSSEFNLSSDQAFTLSAWFYYDGNSNYPSFISKTNSGNGTTAGFNIGHHVSFGGLAFYVGNGTTLGAVVAPYLPWHEWTHVIAWHDPDKDTLNICINGDTVYSEAWAGGTYTDSAQFVIGGNKLAPIYSSVVDTDEVSFWKRVLTPAERKLLYNNGEPLPYFRYSDPTTEAEDVNDATLDGWWKFDQDDGSIVKDLSGNDRNLIVYGTPVWSDKYMNTEVGDYFQSPIWDGPSGTDSFTISCWMKRTDESDWAFPVSNGTWATDGWYFQINSSGHLAFVSASTITTLNSANYVPEGDWHHVVFVKIGGAGHFYVDGVYLGGLVARLNVGTPAYKFTITGVANGNDGGLNGSIDDVRVYNTGKDLTFIENLFAQGRA